MTQQHAVRDAAGKLEAARNRGTIYEYGGSWHCTSHGDLLTAAWPDSLACPRDGCPVKVKVTA